MGAMASKKASASAPVAVWIAWASAGLVKGPVAMIQWPDAGRLVTSSYDVEIRGCACSRSVTARAKGSRSTASAPPAGKRCLSAIAMIRPPAERISQ